MSQPLARFDRIGGFGFTAAYAPARGHKVSRPRAADDFATIRARLDELRRERGETTSGPDTAPSEVRESAAERYRRERMEGLPPPWVPTIFVKQPPV